MSIRNAEYADGQPPNIQSPRVAFVAELLNAQVIVPKDPYGLSPGDAGKYSVHEELLVALARKNTGRFGYPESVPMNPAEASVVVADVMEGFARDGLFTPAIFRMIEPHFAHGDIVSVSHNQTYMAKSVHGRITVDLTDDGKFINNLRALAFESGISLNWDDARILARRKTAAHEVGHVAKYAAVITAAKNQLGGFERSGSLTPKMEEETLRYYSELYDLEMYDRYPLNPVSEQIVGGDGDLERQTSTERATRALEYYQMEKDLLRMGYPAMLVSEFIARYRAYHRSLENDYAALCRLVEMRGISYTSVLRTFPRSMDTLIRHGIPGDTARTMVGIGGVHLGYANGLTFDQLTDWISLLERQLR